MKTILMLVLSASVIIAFGLSLVSAQTPSTSSVDRLDPALDKLVSPDAKVEAIKTDYFQIGEGPIWVQQAKSGFLLFSDVGANVIYKWEPGCVSTYPCPIENGKLSVYLEHSGFTDKDKDVVLPNHGGSNGLGLDSQGRVIMASYGERAIVRLEKDGTRTTLAGGYDGKRFSCPNDLVVKSDGAVYFTDGPTNCINGDTSPNRELDYHGFFVVKDGKVHLLGKDPEGSAPNGITLSPDEKILYVTAGKKVDAYDVQPDDTVANGRLFVDTSGNVGRGGPDGMRVDVKGDVWVTGPGGIWIVSPQGQHLGTIIAPLEVGVRFANFAFGDTDRKTLYMLGGKSFSRIRLNIAGPIRPQLSGQE